MKVLLISDIHSNFSALDAVLERARYDDVIFLGDVVDYGPSPFEVYSRLKRMRAKRVVGNHDVAAAFGLDCRSSPRTHEAAVRTRERITFQRTPRRALQMLGRAEKTLDLAYGDLRVRALHAAPGDELYRYITKEEAAGLEVEGVNLLLLGHTHVPYEIKDGTRWIVNPGSVGMPKDGDPRASYAVLDTSTRDVQLERVDYDVELVVSELRQLIGDERSIFEQLANGLRTGGR
ncbi:MAG: metallophosphoesterase family protein [Nitrososphaerota archaeon]|nr:metallophosphoesterase family protein [Nitrososphaerota archaeon]MDG6980624.1 metallophosphoesterase family protein [Nitrososphaerota archaeon]MDG7009889.1 metallophosphoesterase family protein [Nitrososphaerota archaeon]MDG7030721.1 metallophosphoesterase family protein [Nitrososphaerota archaeon]